MKTITSDEPTFICLKESGEDGNQGGINDIPSSLGRTVQYIFK